ncbi:hypothetical protein PTTG_09908 [Puccinia triticina 1-1 BBBD Race 1]|uniref:Tet-like 2OG-Fe(II) oxygenase domain-containing protein n=1 Tax=Puccinia triticina (isolate 1-1 / race 1 (BBBD)) TaxID=630390 RepID=A0A0C4F9M7_PUCT1|nr:hypothetical protein PTTG_09908 [Puccinia triticina 1-1 BBBD Race 1]WAR57769.1 hypothetical protein PtB15_8B822 [Puccinia triticina]
MKRVEQIFAENYAQLAPSYFRRMAQQMAENEIPGFGARDKPQGRPTPTEAATLNATSPATANASKSPHGPAVLDPAPLDPAPLDPAPLEPAPLDPAPLDSAPDSTLAEFASNFTFTIKNFHNRAHVDNDQSIMTIGMWVTVDLDSKKPCYNPGIAPIQHGQLVFPGISTVVHFEDHPGAIWIMWPGKELFHQTVQSSEPIPDSYGHFTRLGCSAQISRNTNLYCAAQKQKQYV